MNTNQNNASLELAKRLSETVNAAWESSELLEQVTTTDICDRCKVSLSAAMGELFV